MVRGAIFNLALAAAAWLLQGSEPRAKEHQPAPRNTQVLTVALSTQVDLPLAARRQIAAEVRRIWTPHLAVNGLDVEAPAAGVPALRIAIVRGALAPGPAELPYALATFTRSDALVSISFESVRRVMDDGLSYAESNYWPDVRKHFALGCVIGRAIAHEIGHYLLGPLHSRSGLMRAAFQATELVDPRQGIFRLAGDDTVRMADLVPTPAATSPGQRP